MTTMRDAHGLDTALPEDSAATRELLPDDMETIDPSIPSMVLCDCGEHCAPANGQPCPRCFHGCATPGDPRCPGHEGDAPA